MKKTLSDMGSRCFIGMLFCLVSHIALALPLNQTLPNVSVQDKGEILLKPNSDDVTYQPWNTHQLTGKIRVVQHMAGRISAKTINQPLIDAIKAAKLDAEKYQTTNIINLDDALIGTGPFVTHEVISNKHKFPWASFVLDHRGTVRHAWHLSEKNSAIILLDRQGKVLFFKEGALTPKEVESTMALIRSQLN